MGSLPHSHGYVTLARLLGRHRTPCGITVFRFDKTLPEPEETFNSLISKADRRTLSHPGSSNSNALSLASASDNDVKKNLYEMQRPVHELLSEVLQVNMRCFQELLTCSVRSTCATLTSCVFFLYIHVIVCFYFESVDENVF